MNKDILSTVLLYESKTFRIIKPFYCSFCHLTTPFVHSPLPEPKNNYPTATKIGKLCVCKKKAARLIKVPAAEQHVIN